VAWWLEAVLLLIGTVSMGWFAWNWIASESDQLWSNYALDAQLDGRKPTVTGFVRHLAGARHEEQERTAEESKPPAEGEAIEEPGRKPRVHIPRGTNIGRIEIPRLKISSIVRQGVDDKTLSRAVGHVPYTALPGESGNVGLAAHRDTYFRNLRDVREGDIIRVVTTEGTFEYEVDSLTIVTPKNVEVLDPTPHPALTLVTCYPFNYVGHAPKRFIVRARQRNLTEPKRGA
jgi:LPXTG-site transpeptidase (sortase) family protein